LLYFWRKEVQKIKLDSQREQAEEIPTKVVTAVIKKWLDFTRSENLTEYLIWRLKLLQFKFTKFEMHIVISQVNDLKEQDEEKLYNWEKKKTHEYGDFGKTVVKVYPLLNPEIKTKKARMK
jgi:hypothetical protein